MIIGNLTRDPESRTLPSGVAVSTFGVATNLIWTDPNGQKQQKVEFHNVVAWRKLAEICNQYLRKGNKVYIEGRLQTREWVGQDGVKRYRTEIIAENMIMLDARGSSGSSALSEPQDSAESSPIPPSHQPESENVSEPDVNEIKIEDIPF